MHAAISSLLIAVMWALICCRATALSDQMWLRASGAFMDAGDGGEEEEEEGLSGSGCIIFFPFLSSSRQQAPVKWLWVPPTVKLIELVIRGGKRPAFGLRRCVCIHAYISPWQRNSQAQRRWPDPWSVFLDKMSLDVAKLHLTCVTLLQNVRDVLSCRRLVF